MAIMVSFTEFRQALALAPEAQASDNKEARKSAEKWAIEVAGIAPLFYGTTLDRLNLWGRIDSGVVVAASKSATTDDFCAELLKHICADATKVAKSKDFAELLKAGAEIDMNILRNVIRDKHLLICVYARERWEETKVKREAYYAELDKQREEEWQLLHGEAEKNMIDLSAPPAGDITTSTSEGSPF